MTAGDGTARRVWRRLACWLAAPADREHVLGDLDEMAVARERAHGAASARHWYRKQVTGLLLHRLQSRRRRPAVARRQGDSIMRLLAQDLRHAVRTLAHQRAYVAVAVLSLGLAIGLNGLIYGLVDSLILNPYAFPDPSRLVSIGSAFPKMNSPEGFVERHSPAEVDDFRAAATLRSVASFDIGNRAISNGAEARRELTALLVDDPLPALGRPAHLGRGFTAEELAPGGPDVVILGHRVWRELFGADPAIVGRVVRVNSQSRTVVGVLDAGTSLLGTQLWIPWGANASEVARNQRQFTIVARLAPGVALREANAELATIAARTTGRFGSQFPEYEGWRVRAVPWAEAITGQVRGAGTLLLGAGVAILLIACANLASLMLARLNARRREIAVRLAMGAGRWQVARLLVVESLALAALSCVAGVGVAWVAIQGVPRLLPTDVINALATPALSGRALAYCALVAVAAALVTTLVPAWRAQRTPPQAALRDGTAGGGHRQRLRRALVVVELALAVVLLVGAAQMLASFTSVLRADPGFRYDRVATMRLTLAAERYGAGDRATRFFHDLVDRVGALPGVTHAAAASQFPPVENFRIRFQVAGAPPTDAIPTSYVTLITPGYFDVLGIPLRHGRLLSAADRADAPLAVVVNEAFTRQFLEGRTGGRLIVGNNRRDAEIVGVVADARNASLLRPVQPELFAAIEQIGGSNQYFLLARTEGDPMSAVPAIRQTLAAMDPDQPLYVIQSMEDAVAGSLFTQRVSLVLVAIAAAGALVVAGIGVYGVVAFFVASRTREIGIRLALGANVSRVMRAVLGQTAWLLAIGAVVGLTGGIFAARLAGRTLYDSPRIDVAAIAGVVLLLIAAGALAAWLPARRAIRLDPARVLRAE